MKTFLHWLLWVGGIAAFNSLLSLLLGMTLDNPLFPLWMIWCGGSGTIVGLIAAETAP